ncbi:tail fiber assembly protein [Escherichia coli]|nr:tail fiber assembly protein [Escherichia coli]
MDMTFAVIENNVVVNMIVWDGVSDYRVGGDQTLIQVPGSGVGGPAPGIGWHFGNGVFTPPPQPVKTHDELVSDAEQERQSRLAHANAVTADWRTDLLLGTVSDEDKAKLVVWMRYIKDVKALDTSNPTDISWPLLPAE